MIEIVYTPGFVRQYKKLPPALQEEAKEKIALFRKDQQHTSLHTHKLKGKLRKHWSFSINYNCRVIFEYDSKNVVALLRIGDHSMYNM